MVIPNDVALDDEALTPDVLPDEGETEPVKPTEKEPAKWTRGSRRAFFRRLMELAAQEEGAAKGDDDKEGTDKAIPSAAKDVQALIAQREQELRAERERAAKLEMEMQERYANERRERLAVLEQLMDDENASHEERRKARQEYMALSFQEYQDQLARWEAYKRSEILSAGLDPDDPRFKKQYSPGQAGLAEFMADLRAAEAEKLKRELEKAKKSSPAAEDISALVQKELRKILAQMGMDSVDMGQPGAVGDDDDEWEKAVAAFQSGRMSPEEFRKKWGKRK